MKHQSTRTLTDGLDRIRQSPTDSGVLELIVRRPRTDEREILDSGELDLVAGLVGDKWKPRAGSDRQLTVTNARLMALLAGDKRHWPPAGDQLYVDFDLSADNAPPGTCIAIGAAVIQVTEPPHTGCKKFAGRYGLDALKFVNSPIGKHLRLRGINAKVIRAGTIRVGDSVTKC